MLADTSGAVQHNVEQKVFDILIGKYRKEYLQVLFLIFEEACNPEVTNLSRYKT
jgi:hypothetical protein